VCSKQQAGQAAAFSPSVENWKLKIGKFTSGIGMETHVNRSARTTAIFPIGEAVRQLRECSGLSALFAALIAPA
jgi:hypothetical protein